MHLRRALPHEAGALTDLAIRSKRHWGYDEAFMTRAIPDLRISEELLTSAVAIVAEREERVAGFYVLQVDEGVPTLRDLWVEPGEQRSGVGRALFEHMRGEARRRRYPTVRFASDPFAEGFYVRMGARRIGDIESTTVPGRMLPLMEVESQPEGGFPAGEAGRR